MGSRFHPVGLMGAEAVAVPLGGSRFDSCPGDCGTEVPRFEIISIPINTNYDYGKRE